VALRQVPHRARIKHAAVYAELSVERRSNVARAMQFLPQPGAAQSCLVTLWIDASGNNRTKLLNDNHIPPHTYFLFICTYFLFIGGCKQLTPSLQNLKWHAEQNE